MLSNCRQNITIIVPESRTMEPADDAKFDIVLGRKQIEKNRAVERQSVVEVTPDSGVSTMVDLIYSMRNDLFASKRTSDPNTPLGRMSAN